MPVTPRTISPGTIRIILAALMVQSRDALRDLTKPVTSYLYRTFRPWASSGVHPIFVADKGKLAPASFDSQCVRLAGTLQALCEQHAPSLDFGIALQP